MISSGRLSRFIVVIRGGGVRAARVKVAVREELEAAKYRVPRPVVRVVTCTRKWVLKGTIYRSRRLPFMRENVIVGPVPARLRRPLSELKRKQLPKFERRVDIQPAQLCCHRVW